MGERKDSFDFEALARDLSELRRAHLGPADAEDFAHLKKLERWVERANTLGYASAWIAPNLISALLLSTSTFARWAILSHHISHKAFDRVPDIPERYTSRGWAQGRSRWRDWLDWIEPEAWHEEHDLAHHYRLGEEADPDLVEDKLSWLREARLPKAAKLAFAMVLGAVWKPFYYAPNTLLELRAVRARRAGQDLPEESLSSLGLWAPWTPQGRELWTQSWLPYVGRRFIATPALFAPLGPWAVFSVWANSLLAELLTNLHAFIVIVPNHAGEDVMRFDTPTRSKGEFYYRQIVGSVNYRTAGDFNDFLHGWLNYQIEHHLFPRATPRQLQRLQAPVKALCERHGIPYIQEPVTTRLRKMLDVMVGATSMLRQRVGA